MAESIRRTVDGDGVALLEIDVADRPMNVATPGFLRELEACIEQVAADGVVRGALIASAKPSFIMAGADIKDMASMFERGITAAEATRFSANLNRIFRRLETCGKPVAAAINGVALGAGLELALACHYRVLAEEPRSGVGFPEVKIGLLPGAGGTQRLPRLIGVTEAVRLMTEGRQVDAAEALRKGIVHELAPAAEIVTRARRWLLGSPEPTQPWDRKEYRVPGGAGMSTPAIAQTFMSGTALAARAAMRNYPAPLAILTAVYEGTQVPIDLVLRIESQQFGRLLAGPVARNMMRTMFVNKGQADKLLRRPAAPPKATVRRLGILGAGTMGAGVACVSATAGAEVVLLDRSMELAEQGKARARQQLDREVGPGRRTAAEAAAVLERIRPTAAHADLAGCDFVIEAVTENREIKADVTRSAQAVIAAPAVLASITSTLPISGLAQAVQRPERFIGMHFLPPVEKMPLVEIIVGRKTAEETLARTLDFVGQLRTTPIVVNDSRGFYTTRCFGTFLHEGMQLLAEGVAPALIENADRMAGMSAGPLAMADEVTLDLQWRAIREAEQDLGSRFRRPVSYDVVRRFVEELGRPGRRFGAGFYDYPDGGRKRLWPGLASIFPAVARQPEPGEVRMRLLYVQALEAARCMEEAVVTTAAEADLGSVLGWGFPAWTGGTLSYVDTLGAREFVADCDRLAKRYGRRFKPSRWLRDRAEHGAAFHARKTSTA